MLSIIIPTYNRAILLKETLDSIRVQTYKDWECLVIDDGSTDGTEATVSEMIKMDARFQYFKRPAGLPKGANACRNFGFGRSKGEFINWFDSDDLMREDHYELKVNALLKHGAAHCVIAQLEYFEEKDGLRIYSEAKPIPKEDLVEQYIIGKCSIGTTNPVWRRAVIEAQPKLFDTEIIQSQDLELYSRIFKDFGIIVVIDQSLIQVRKVGNSISSRLLQGDHEALRSYVTVRKRILALKYGENVRLGMIRNLMYIFRLALGHKHYDICDNCLQIVKGELIQTSLKSKWQMFRVDLVYQWVRTLGFGETRMRKWLHF